MVLLTAFMYNLMCAFYSCEHGMRHPESTITRRHVNPEDLHPDFHLYPLIETRNGKVRGYSMGSTSGKGIFAFEGIPYAEPPIGILRWQSPVPKRSWSEELHAFKPSSKCLQGHPLNALRVVGSEDCLYLNVYTPQEHVNWSSYKMLRKLFPKKNIHLRFSSSFMKMPDVLGSEYGPAYLLERNVILVTLNYRLGAFGFLSTGDEESPGNYGLKDQSLAIRWVSENIASFGGDPNRITVMGQSAGGVSAHLHGIANGTRPYFQAGVSLSGSAFTHWGILTPERAKHWTSQLASKVNCLFDNNQKLMECLKRTNPAFVVAAQLRIFEWAPLHPLIVFAPVIEPNHSDAFLTSTALETYAKNEVARYPWIFGVTSQEGHFELYVLQALLQYGTVHNRFRDYLPILLDYNYLLREPMKSNLTDRLIQFYDATDSISVRMNALSQMFSDRYFVVPIENAIRAHSQVAPTYAFVFDYKGEYNIGSIFGVAPNNWGVAHGEDMFYFFNSSAFYHGFTKQESAYRLSQIMNNFLVNFANTREPMYSESEAKLLKVWNTVDPAEDDIQFLQFNADIRMIPNPFQRRTKFWKDVKIE